MINKIKDRLILLGLDFKKEVTAFFLINVLIIPLVIGSILYLQIIYSILTILFGLIMNVLFFYRYVLIKEKINNENEQEFITMINYLEVFLSNQMNVYNAFLNVRQYCNNYVSYHIDILIGEIDLDKTIKPYINFSHAFKTSIYEDIMISIYQMSLEGESASRLNQFEFQFLRIKENSQQLQINKKARQLDTLTTYPLICSAFITIVLTLSILLVMGDIINVI